MKKIFRVFKGNKAYYALVAVCITAVGTVVTTVVRDYMEESAQRNLALSEEIMIPAVTEPPVAAADVQTIPTPDKFAAHPQTVETPAKSQETLQPTSAEQFAIIPPVTGNILRSFSGNELVYDKTFEDWRVHSGIDIAAERSEAVKACAQGIVEEVFLDANDGITIVLDHGNQYQSVYQNLSTEKMVKKGETVQKGQAISGVGETGVSEAGMASHLHFELKRNGESVDPVLYYKK